MAMRAGLVATIADIDLQRLQALVLVSTAMLTCRHPDDRDLVLVRLLQLVEVRDALAARAAPGGPELDHIHFFLLEAHNRATLDPSARHNRWGWSSDREPLLRLSRGEGCTDPNKENGDERMSSFHGQQYYFSYEASLASGLLLHRLRFLFQNSC